ncbi:MAG: FAD-dependent oxidoreductase [Paracoccaceae bacterium]
MSTLIIGGGLSGLALADELQTQGRDYMLVEAQGRFGGRIKTRYFGAGYFDLGPTWIWPGQPRISTLIEQLEIKSFDQYTDGQSIFEDEMGRVQRGVGFASMEGSWRLHGGFEVLTSLLSERLPTNRKRLNARVTALKKSETGITATFSNGDAFSANHAVLALPPRIAANIEYFPALPERAFQKMQSVATWMAGQAKAVAVYDKPFWRGGGLSGNAMSRIGPLVEIHDASPVENGPYALFGFIGVPAEARKDEQALRRQILAQLARLFGGDANEPERLYIEDWAHNSNTSTTADSSPQYAHPTYGMPRSLINLWDGRLLFGGTEVAAEFGGYVEGALEAAEYAIRSIDELGVDDGDRYKKLAT